MKDEDVKTGARAKARKTRRRAPQTAAGEELRRRFASNVRVLRHFQKISQEALAERSGMSRSFISLIEGGHFSITLETLAALAEALDSSPTQLLGPSERLYRRDEVMNRPPL